MTIVTNVKLVQISYALLQCRNIEHQNIVSRNGYTMYTYVMDKHVSISPEP